MKKLIVYSVLFLMLPVAFMACSPDKPTVFNEPDAIYFNTTTDSMAYTFAKYPNRKIDTLKIAANVLGSPVATDREIILESLSGPDVTAKEGVHYKLLAPYKMPANKVSTLVPIVVYRTGDLDSISVTMKIGLKENSNFELGFSAKSYIKIKIGYLQKPASWGEYGGSQWAGSQVNFGTWTKTKYKLILDALYDKASDTTVSEFPYLRIGAPAISLQYLQMTRNYILTNYPGNYSVPEGIGPTLRDPDAGNQVIKVGQANY